MIDKNKIFYLIIGIVVGVILTIGISKVLESNKSLTHIETNNFHENEPNGSIIEDNHEGDEEIVSLNDEEIKELGIILDKVGSEEIQMHADLSGEVVPDPDQVAHIVPRFTGIVKNVYKKIGDNVKQGEVIAVIESNESLVTYNVESSIDGVVLNLHLTPGELIGDDNHVVTIANLNSVWAELNVYQNDLQKIKIGQWVDIYVNKLEKSVKGKIFYISPTVDEHTRTATARVSLNNSRGYWKPGMFVNSRVSTNSVKVKKAVTLNSIQNYEGQKVVFVKMDDGFVPQPVTLGRTNSTYVEIVSGLSEGQTYIAEGAFVIKSELLKESFGGGHGH